MRQQPGCGGSGTSLLSSHTIPSMLKSRRAAAQGLTPILHLRHVPYFTPACSRLRMLNTALHAPARPCTRTAPHPPVDRGHQHGHQRDGHEARHHQHEGVVARGPAQRVGGRGGGGGVNGTPTVSRFTCIKHRTRQPNPHSRANCTHASTCLARCLGTYSMLPRTGIQHVAGSWNKLIYGKPPAHHARPPEHGPVEVRLRGVPPEGPPAADGPSLPELHAHAVRAVVGARVLGVGRRAGRRHIIASLAWGAERQGSGRGGAQSRQGAYESARA